MEPSKHNAPPTAPTNAAPPTPPRRVDPARAACALKRATWLAKFLDNAIPIPGTSQRLGFDAIIGLVPGVGDFVTTAMGSYVIIESVRVKAPGSMIAKMVGNVALDAVLGAVPGLGDVADVFFRSNARNLALLRGHLERELGTPAADIAGLLGAEPAPRRSVANEAVGQASTHAMREGTVAPA